MHGALQTIPQDRNTLSPTHPPVPRNVPQQQWHEHRAVNGNVVVDGADEERGLTGYAQGPTLNCEAKYSVGHAFTQRSLVFTLVAGAIAGMTAMKCWPAVGGRRGLGFA